MSKSNYWPTFGGRPEPTDAEQEAQTRHEAQEALNSLNNLCGWFDQEDSDDVIMDDFLRMRNGELMPRNHRGPEPGKFFLSSNFTSEQFAAVAEALEIVGCPEAEEGLARICRAYVDARKARGAA